MRNFEWWMYSWAAGDYEKDENNGKDKKPFEDNPKEGNKDNDDK